MIFLQARSSSQRKEVFKQIQVNKNIPAVQLLLDMKVRWGSTYVMLDRAELRREVCISLFNTVILQSILLSGGWWLRSRDWAPRKKPRKKEENICASAYGGWVGSGKNILWSTGCTYSISIQVWLLLLTYIWKIACRHSSASLFISTGSVASQRTSGYWGITCSLEQTVNKREVCSIQGGVGCCDSQTWGLLHKNGWVGCSYLGHV